MKDTAVVSTGRREVASRCEGMNRVMMTLRSANASHGCGELWAMLMEPRFCVVSHCNSAEGQFGNRVDDVAEGFPHLLHNLGMVGMIPEVVIPEVVIPEVMIAVVVIPAPYSKGW